MDAIDESVSQEQRLRVVKQCPKCQLEVPKRALRCPSCRQTFAQMRLESKEAKSTSNPRFEKKTQRKAGL